MTDIIQVLLRMAGPGLILLAIMHVPISRKLKWKEESAFLSPVNADIFLVHAFFICVLLVLMGLPCLLEPMLFLEGSRASIWLSWSLSLFWFLRLYFQWFVYCGDLWRGKRMETTVHWFCSLVWLLLAGVFGLCGAIQSGWLK